MINRFSKQNLLVLIILISFFVAINAVIFERTQCTSAFCTNNMVDGFPRCEDDFDLQEYSVGLCNGKASICYKRLEYIPYKVSNDGYHCFSRDGIPCDENRDVADMRNGDTDYCIEKPYNVSCIVQTTPCYCKKGTYDFKTVCVDNVGNKFNYTLNTITGKTQRMVTLNPLEDSKIIKDPIGLVSADLEKVVINCPFGKNCLVLINVNKNFTDILNCTGSCSLVRTKASRLIPSMFKYQITFERLTYKGSLKLPAEEFCSQIDCLFCKDALDNSDCLSGFEKFILYTVVALLLITLILLPLLIIVIIGYIIFRVSKSCYKFCSKYKNKRRASKLSSKNVKISLAHLAIIALFIPLILAECDLGMSVQSTSSSCVQGTTEEVCTYSVTNLINLVNVGDIACLNIYDQNGIYLDSIKVKYNYFLNEMAAVLDFYTSNWRQEHMENANCEHADNCDDDYCSDINNGYEMTPNGIPEYYDEYPQFIRCDMLPDNSYLGCAYNRGCNYNSWIVIPIGHIMKSYKFESVYATSEIEVISRNNNETFIVRQGGTSVFEDDGVKLVLAVEGWLGTTNLLNPREYSNVFYPDMILDTTSFKGDAKLGSLYELQSTTQEDLINHSTDLLHADFCKYDAINWENSQISCVNSRFNTSSTMKRIPLQLNNGIITSKVAEDNLKSLIGTFTEGPGLTLSLDFRGLTAVREISKCTNEFIFKNATGCYSCSTGTDLLFEAKVTDNCTWVVSSETLKINTNNIKAQKFFVINTSPSTEKNKHTVSFDNTGTIYNVEVEFKSVDPEIEIDPIFTYNTTTNGETGNTYDDDDIGGFFEGIFTNWISVIFYVTLFIAFLVIIVLLISCCCKML